MAGLTVYHIPVCPFSQRLEILLALKRRRDDVRFHVVDITQPRPDWLLAKTRGTTALPVLETASGATIKESLVILQYLEDIFPEPAIAQRDPYARAVENMLVRFERDFVAQGYRFVLNQDAGERAALRDGMLREFARLDAFLREHAPEGPWLSDRFGWAETVFTPFFVRFAFLDYYEDFALPEDASCARVAQWRAACLAHPDAQQVSAEEVVKSYYDYAQGAGNGALLPGRARSSFAFAPYWRERPWPPREKFGRRATDAELGL